jgi:hypothetical protein
MSLKISQSTDKISPFGGFNFCHQLLGRTGIPQLVDSELGKRVKKVGFNYSDIFSNHLAVFLSGGDCTEDIQEHLHAHLKEVRGLSVCSADTILRGIKELATPIEELTGPTGVEHFFNINMPLNKLMVKALVKTGQLKTGGGTGHTLDYDNQVVPTEKYDALKTYKHCEGYQPGVASIGKLVVYIEGRNGNSPAKYRQEETLGRAFGLLEDSRISTERFRADVASYQQSVVELAERKCRYFYIRAMRCADMEQQIAALPKDAWKKIRLGTQGMEVAQIENYLPFGGEKTYRLVVSRIKRKDGQAGLFTGDAHTYRGILTNDREWANEEVVSFYNQRGGTERTFDMMNNDFGWSKLPCSFLNENTAFMIMTAIHANLYQFIIATFSKKVSWLKENFRLKKFVFRFITVAAKWIRTGGRDVLKLYTSKDYSPLLC